MTVFYTAQAYTQELNLGGEPETTTGKSVSEKNTMRAEEFFKDCVAAPIVKSAEETELAFCACAASHMHAWLDEPLKQKSNREFFEALETKELDKNTLLTKIYGPCLHIPVYDTTFDECFYNKRKRYFTRSPEKRENMCACIAKGEASYYERFAVPFIELKIKEGDDINDPIKEIKRDTSYYDAHANLESDCYVEFSNQK